MGGSDQVSRVGAENGCVLVDGNTALTAALERSIQRAGFPIFGSVAAICRSGMRAREGGDSWQKAGL